MVCSFFQNERGGIDYLIKNPTARIVRGNAELTRALIESHPPGRGQRYLSGVANDNTMPAAVADRATQELGVQLRAGLPWESLHILEVEHGDKGRRERHVIVPHTELITGKSYAPYVDRIDRHRFLAWTESFNLRHGLDNPLDRLREKPDYSRSRLSREDQEFLMAIYDVVHTAVQADYVHNRDEMVALLVRSKVAIRALTKMGRPLEQPVITTPRGNTLRLHGSIYYHPDFGPDLYAKLEQRKKQPKEERIAELQKIIDEGLDFRAHHIIGRLFGRTQQRRIPKGKARQSLKQLMQEAASQHRVTHPRIAVFSEKKERELLHIFSLLHRQNQLPTGADTTQETPKEAVRKLLENLTSEVNGWWDRRGQYSPMVAKPRVAPVEPSRPVLPPPPSAQNKESPAEKTPKSPPAPTPQDSSEACPKPASSNSKSSPIDDFFDL